MARSILKGSSPSPAPSSPGDNQSAGHDISATAGFVISIVFLICIIINFVLRLFLAAKYNQWLQRQANAATLAKPKVSLLQEEISLLPKFIYHPSTNGSALDCSVCINELVDGEMFRVLPTCKHFFHVECIDKWLCTHSSCPLCRANLEPEKVKLGTVSVSPALPQFTLCTPADEQWDLGSLVSKNPLEASPQLESLIMSTSGTADLHDIRVEVQPE